MEITDTPDIDITKLPQIKSAKPSETALEKPGSATTETKKPKTKAELAIEVVEKQAACELVFGVISDKVGGDPAKMKKELEAQQGEQKQILDTFKAEYGITDDEIIELNKLKEQGIVSRNIQNLKGLLEERSLLLQETDPLKFTQLLTKCFQDAKGIVLSIKQILTLLKPLAKSYVIDDEGYQLIHQQHLSELAAQIQTFKILMGRIEVLYQYQMTTIPQLKSKVAELFERDLPESAQQNGMTYIIKKIDDIIKQQSALSQQFDSVQLGMRLNTDALLRELTTNVFKIEKKMDQLAKELEELKKEDALLQKQINGFKHGETGLKAVQAAAFTTGEPVTIFLVSAINLGTKIARKAIQKKQNEVQKRINKKSTQYEQFKILKERGDYGKELLLLLSNRVTLLTDFIDILKLMLEYEKQKMTTLRDTRTKEDIQEEFRKINQDQTKQVLQIFKDFNEFMQDELDNVVGYI